MIRPIEQADAPAVRSLQAHLRYSDSALVDATIWGPFLGRVAIADSTVGYAIGLPGQPATLSELVVSPTHRRRGHGRALVEGVIEGLEAEAIEVTTPADSSATKQFYERCEFEPARQISNFYSDETDALRLVRRE